MDMCVYMYIYTHTGMYMYTWSLSLSKNICSWAWWISFDMAEVPVWCSGQILFHLKLTQTIMSHCISSYLILKSYAGHWFYFGWRWLRVVVEPSFKSCLSGLAASLAASDVLQANTHYLLLSCDWTPQEWGSGIPGIVWQFLGLVLALEQALTHSLFPSPSFSLESPDFRVKDHQVAWPVSSIYNMPNR